MVRRMRLLERSPWLLVAALLVPACEPAAEDTAELPAACPAEPVVQSPASFEAGGTAVDEAETCDTEGSAWIPCHQHMHCGPEHSGAGICGDAACEVHTVHRRRKDGGATAAVEHLHEGTVGGNCAPAEHDLLVRATFLAFGPECAAGQVRALTYCGSATGNNTLDADGDHVVTCEESGRNGTSVRWCLETRCVCLPEGEPEDHVETYGEIEASRVQGCPNVAR